MKQFISYLFVLQVFVGHINALYVVPKLNVYPHALRPAFGLKQIIARENKPSQDIILEKVSHEKSALADFSVFMFQCVDVLHQQFVLVSTAPLKMNLSVQPPPSFRLWYAFLDWFP